MSDDQILDLIHADGKLEAGFRVLLRKYQEKLYWHIRRMVLVHEDADDVLQNTFIKVYKGLKNFRGDSKLYTWMYRIATNEALSHIARSKKKMTESFDGEDDVIQNTLRADDYFNGDEITRLLHQAVGRLPEKQRLVFHMRYFDNMTYKDIAEATEISVGGLKASYHHAVKKIEEFIKSQDHG